MQIEIKLSHTYIVSPYAGFRVAEWLALPKFWIGDGGGGSPAGDMALSES